MSSLSPKNNFFVSLIKFILNFQQTARFVSFTVPTGDKCYAALIKENFEKYSVDE